MVGRHGGVTKEVVSAPLLPLVKLTTNCIVVVHCRKAWWREKGSFNSLLTSLHETFIITVDKYCIISGEFQILDLVLEFW